MQRKCWLGLSVAGLLVASALLMPRATAQDATVDWLLQQATTLPTQPATLPATQPSRVLEKKSAIRGRKGAITLSDGTLLRGGLSTTPDKPVRVYDGKEYQDLPFAMISTIEAEVLWERDEKEFRFKESGSDIKEFSGKTYPARELVYKFTLKNGSSVKGGVVAPIFLDKDGEEQMFVLNKRSKGQPGQSLPQLVYPEKIELE